MTKQNKITTSRRGFIATVGVATAGLTALTAGQSFGLLHGSNLFAPRTQRDSPQQVPVNRTAAAAAVADAANDPAWRLQVTAGATTLALSRADLGDLLQTSVTLPIACVEGWSVSAHWVGVRVRDLMALTGAPPQTRVRFTSLEPQGVYRVTEMGPEFVTNETTLVALRLNGETLSLDHGYPARLIAPNRPGVLQTKWLSSVEAIA
ncbi:molybdopterin-dependent oxidoreductase [Microlunatus antarcticus]|uniref:DMSO/TMAO reductase YedYZ molybdopterin-dependent catalytic subunit n=1 Tax=Microlunatus antarcticus TaxID=53388 RepID=A0A7W5JVA7_9ACTN|nr:DMSO/TMAO reductase YedYZ molybdopterin-dependent catalytic subunit [Microlunatus antarcticus]